MVNELKSLLTVIIARTVTVMFLARAQESKATEGSITSLHYQYCDELCLLLPSLARLLVYYCCSE